MDAARAARRRRMNDRARRTLEGAEGIIESMGCPDNTGPTTDSPESTQSNGSAQTRLGRALGDRLASAVTVATTEHFNLQTARAATTAEANGRASIYLAVLSTTSSRWRSSVRCRCSAQPFTRSR